MVIARLLVGVVSASLSVSGAQTGGLPTGKIVVLGMHAQWADGTPVESGGRNYPTDVYVVDANGKHIRNLTHDYPTNYPIGRLPDGRILYESVPNDRMRRGASRIFSIRADGSGRRQLASGKGELLPELSPDGHRILFAHGHWLYVMRSEGTHKMPLAQASFGSYHEGYDASWSPDGKRIAFVRGFETQKAYSAHSALYVVNADGTGLRRLTKVSRKVATTNPTWSPDGDKIAFDEYNPLPTATTGGSYIMRADGTDVRRLKLPGLATDRHWLPNGRIAYVVGGGRVRSIDPKGSGKPQALPNRVRVGKDLWIASGPLAGLWPVSPDGKWIAFVRAGRGVLIEHLDGTHRRLVTRKIGWGFVSNWGIGSAIEWAGS